MKTQLTIFLIILCCSLGAQNIFNGFTGDGSAKANFKQSDVSFINIFHGGVGDGTTKDKFRQLNIQTQNIFKGGGGDGASRVNFGQVDNSVNPIFKGGRGDGAVVFRARIFGAAPPIVALPIELVSFYAKVKGEWVVLTWETATEINNDYFTIERSSDAKMWEDVSETQGAGNSTASLRYKDVDENPLNGVSYYRLKQTDFDNAFSYSQIEMVNFINEEEISEALSIFPNPTKGLITITGDKKELQWIRIYNMLGQNVTRTTHFISKSDNSKTFDISDLPKGMYTLKTKTEATKIIKE